MALKEFLLDSLSSSPAYSKSMVELEPGKVLHDRRERLFGPLVFSSSHSQPLSFKEELRSLLVASEVQSPAHRRDGDSYF